MSTGRRAGWAVAAAACAAALGAGAATAEAQGERAPGADCRPGFARVDGRCAAREFRPERGPLRPEGACPRGYEQGTTGRCFRRCPVSHELLAGPGLRGGRCVPRRPTRLWYRVALDVSYTLRTDVPVGVSGANPRGLRVDGAHRWSFRSDGAVILFRQCTAAGALNPVQGRLGFGLTPAIPCGRQARALGLPAAVEDASFAAMGTVTGGDFREDRAELQPIDFCQSVLSTTHTGSGGSVPALLGTRVRSLRGGLAMSASPDQQTLGAGTYSDAGRVCQPRFTTPPSSRPSPSPVLSGLELVNDAGLNIGAAFGRPQVTLARDVSMTNAGPLGTTTRTAIISLTLTRCPAREGRTPEGC